eukprot:Clim_evm40s210 gene=Clim_evmTU40s210
MTERKHSYAGPSTSKGKEPSTASKDGLSLQVPTGDDSLGVPGGQRHSQPASVMRSKSLVVGDGSPPPTFERTPTEESSWNKAESSDPTIVAGRTVPRLKMQNRVGDPTQPPLGPQTAGARIAPGPPGQVPMSSAPRALRWSPYMVASSAEPVLKETVDPELLEFERKISDPANKRGESTASKLPPGGTSMLAQDRSQSLRGPMAYEAMRGTGSVTAGSGFNIGKKVAEIFNISQEVVRRESIIAKASKMEQLLQERQLQRSLSGVYKDEMQLRASLLPPGATGGAASHRSLGRTVSAVAPEDRRRSGLVPATGPARSRSVQPDAEDAATVTSAATGSSGKKSKSYEDLGKSEMYADPTAVKVIRTSLTLDPDEVEQQIKIEDTEQRMRESGDKDATSAVTAAADTAKPDTEVEVRETLSVPVTTATSFKEARDEAADGDVATDDQAHIVVPESPIPTPMRIKSHYPTEEEQRVMAERRHKTEPRVGKRVSSPSAHRKVSHMRNLSKGGLPSHGSTGFLRAVWGDLGPENGGDAIPTMPSTGSSSNLPKMKNTKSQLSQGWLSNGRTTNSLLGSGAGTPQGPASAEYDASSDSENDFGTDYLLPRAVKAAGAKFSNPVSSAGSMDEEDFTEELSETAPLLRRAEKQIAWRYTTAFHEAQQMDPDRVHLSFDEAILQATVLMGCAQDLARVDFRMDARSLEIVRTVKSVKMRFAGFCVLIISMALAVFEYPQKVSPTTRMVVITLQILCLLFYGFTLALRACTWPTMRPVFTLRYGPTVVVLIASLVDTGFAVWYPTYNMPVARSLRTFFWFYVDRDFRKYFGRLLFTIPSLLPIFSYMFSLILMFALMGMSIFQKEKEGKTQFPDLATSMESLLNAVTLANTPGVAVDALESSFLHFPFFFVFLTFGNLVLMNLILANVYTTYRALLADAARSDYAYFLTITNMVFRRLKCAAHSKGKEDIDFEIMQPFFERLGYNRKMAAVMFCLLDTERDGVIEEPEFEDIYYVFGMKIQPSTYSSCPLSDRPKMVRWWATGKVWWGTCLLLVASMFTVAGEILYCIPIDETGHKSVCWGLRSTNYVIFLVGTVEVIFNVFMIMYGRVAPEHTAVPTYFQALDAFAVFIQWLMVAVRMAGGFQYAHHYFLAIMAFRMYRALSLIPAYRGVTQNVVRLIAAFSRIAILVVVIYYFFTIIGLHLFADVMNEETKKQVDGCYADSNYWVLNFNSFHSAATMLYFIMLQNDWYCFMDAYGTLTSEWHKWFFIIWYVASICLVLNVIIAFIIEGFESHIMGTTTNYTLRLTTRTAASGEEFHELDWEAELQAEEMEHTFPPASPRLSSTLRRTSSPHGVGAVGIGGLPGVTDLRDRSPPKNGSPGPIDLSGAQDMPPLRMPSPRRTPNTTITGETPRLRATGLIAEGLDRRMAGSITNQNLQQHFSDGSDYGGGLGGTEGGLMPGHFSDAESSSRATTPRPSGDIPMGGVPVYVNQTYDRFIVSKGDTFELHMHQLLHGVSLRNQ